MADPFFIQDAGLQKGAFRAKAAAKGVSTQTLAKQDKGAKGKLGKQARMALILSTLRKKIGGGGGSAA